MTANRKGFWILAAILAVPLLSAGAKAIPFQGGGYSNGPGNGGRRGPVSPDEELKRMTKDFNLTAGQQAKIKPILADQQKQREDVRNDTNTDRTAMRRKMMQIHQDTSGQVRAQLDDKQKEKFDKQDQERKERMQNHRGAPGGQGDNSSGNPPPPQT